MEKQMNKRLKLGLIIVILVSVALFAAYWAIIINQPQIPIFQQRRLPQGLPQGFITGDFELFYIAFTIISTINIALLVILTLVYIDIYAKTRSDFTIGLIIFALVFLVKDVTSSPLIMAILGFRAYGLGPFEFLPGLFEFFALTILLYLSNK
jgi:hypothetical protein